MKIRTKELVFLPASTLRANAKNWRTHPTSQRRAMGAALEEIGFAGAILARKNQAGEIEILDGHLRVEQAKDETLPVLLLDLDDAEADKLLATFDPISDLAKPDQDKLRMLLSDMKSEQAGFKALLEKVASESRVSSLIRAEPETKETNQEKELPKLGDLFLLGEHRLLCGDSANADDVARLFSGMGKARLMNTDPPYGIDYSKTKDGIPWSGFENHQDLWGDIQNDSLEGKSLQEFLQKVFSAALPHLDNAAWYLWHAHLTQGFFSAAAAAADVILHRQIIWKKPGFVLTRSGMYHWAHEPCFFGWRRGEKPAWHGNNSQTSVWEISRDKEHGKFHPTQKPVELFRIPMLNHTLPGEICYEPFCGSGSQIIAGEMLGRRVFAIEIEPRYVATAISRWEALSGKRAERVFSPVSVPRTSHERPTNVP